MLERDFWAQSSGLTPVEQYSLQDHKRFAWKSVLSSSLSNYDDLQYAYLTTVVGKTTDVDTLLNAFWASLSGLTPAQKFSTADHRLAALALSPAVPGGTPTPPNTVFGTALKAAINHTAVSKVAVVGDSIFEGEGASTLANRCIAKFITDIRNKYSIAGTSPGMLGCFHNTNLPESASWRNPLSGNSGAVPNAWFSTQAKRGADLNSVNNYVQWTVTCDSFDIVHLQGTGDGGSLTVTIDGSNPQVINTSTGASLKASQATHINIGGAPASHVIKVLLTAGRSAVDGIVPYIGDYAYGITWWDGADYGDISSDFMSGANPVQPITDIGPYGPSLVIDNIVGTSDYSRAALTPTQVAANLTARLNAYAAYPSAPTVLLVGTYQINSQLTTNNALDFNMQQYFDACHTAGNAKGAVWLDLNTVYPTFAANSGWLASDNGHPSDIGHQKIADAMLAAVA